MESVIGKHLFPHMTSLVEVIEGCKFNNCSTTLPYLELSDACNT